jgi:hypothetical protein
MNEWDESTKLETPIDIIDDLLKAQESIKNYASIVPDTIIMSKRVGEWMEWNMKLPFEVRRGIDKARLKLEMVTLQGWLKWWKIFGKGRKVRKHVKKLKRKIKYYPFEKKFSMGGVLKGAVYKDG